MNLAMVYYEISWYKMPISFQKQVLCAIHEVQHNPVLTMGPLGDLDFEMATSVSKYYSVYSKFTFYLYSPFTNVIKIII